ncbi:MAG: phage tail tube protein [Xanthobacteraceae bacterium]
MAYSDSSYGVFQGKLLIAPRLMNGPLLDGYHDVGDADMFSIDVKQKFEDINESRTGMGLTSAHVPIETSLSVKARLLDIKHDNFARALWGTKTGQVTGATVSAEPITLYNGCVTPLAHPGVTNLTISTLVAGTDYILDAANGSIYVPPTSTAVAAGTPMTTTASYTFGTYSGSTEAFTSGQVVFSVLLQGFNTANSNQPVITRCYQWAPDMAKTLNLIEKKHMAFDLDGMLLLDTTRPAPTAEAPYSQFVSVVKA